MSRVLRYSDPNAVDHPFHARYATVTSGVPGRCPECDDFGYIDSADITWGYQNQRCRGCGTRWSYAFDTEGRILEVHGLPDVAPVGGRLDQVEVVLDLRSPQPARSSGTGTIAERAGS